MRSLVGIVVGALFGVCFYMRVLFVERSIGAVTFLRRISGRI